MKMTILLFSLLFGLALSLATRAQAASVILDWDAVTTNSDGTPITDLAGYTVFRATTSFNVGGVWISTTQAVSMPSITQNNVVATTTTFTASSLSAGTTYYFRLTAYNTSGLQSAFNVDASNNNVEVSTYIPAGIACDVNSDGTVNSSDGQLDINAALGIITCSPTYDINKDSFCNSTDAQRIINAILGGACVTTP